jgi:AcrR family transcriptional regulator
MRTLDSDIKNMRTLVDDADLVREKRRQLAEVATRLFRTNGFHETSTRDIAVEADMSVGAIYQYIRRKEDLLLLILQSVADIYEERLYPLASADGPARDRLAAAVNEYFRTLDEHHEKTQVLYHEFSGLKISDHREYMNQVERTVNDVIQRIIEQGIVAREFARVDALYVAHMITSLGHMWALKRWRFRNVMTIDAYIAETQRTLERLLAL